MDNEKRLVEWERRRRRGARLLEAGVKQAEVARRVGVTRTSVSRCKRLRQEGREEALKRPKRFGRPRRLSDAQCEELSSIPGDD
jgi:transposase